MIEGTMQISTSKDIKNFSPMSVDTNKDLIKCITRWNYSLAQFKDGQRNKANFVQCEAIGLDVDEGMTVDEAEEAFKDYDGMLTTTRNHGVEKNGKVADRFRVIIRLSRPITDVDTYYATWHALKERFPMIDPACKDPSRFFYPSPKDALFYEFKGKKFDPVSPSAKPEPTVEPESVQDAPRGRLSVDTLRFLVEGAPKGSRHTKLFKAAIDAKEQGYDKAWFYVQLNKMQAMTDTWTVDEYFKEVHDQVDDIFSRETKHEPRVVEKAISFRKMSDIRKDAKPVTWIVGGLMYEAGISILAGNPKTGKSTLTKQLAKSIARGETFLGRTVSKGPVLYLALEEQEGLLAEQFKQVGITDEDEIYLHVGSPRGNTVLDDLEEAVTELQPKLLVIDTMLLMLRANDMNNYNEMNQKLEVYRNLARKTGVHILFIHHRNKNEEGSFNSISGSQAIHGAVDCAIIFKKAAEKRILDSSQRGGEPFDHLKLKFDADTQTYSIATDEEF